MYYQQLTILVNTMFVNVGRNRANVVNVDIKGFYIISSGAQPDDQWFKGLMFNLQT